MLFSLRGWRQAPPPTQPIPEPPPAPPRRVGIALGGGAARGWAHIGVLHELAAQGLAPEIIAGTSIGAVVGACYATGKLDHLEKFARSLDRRAILRLLDVSLAGTGLISGGRLKRRLEHELRGLTIEDLDIPFAAVATEVGTGREICLARGSLAESVHASYALPGIFQPVRLGGRWLFDGAMSNPVPVSVARALGADFVIGVNLTSDLGGPIGKPQVDMMRDPSVAKLDDLAATIPLDDQDLPPPVEMRKQRLAFIRRRLSMRRTSGAPGIASVMVGAFSIAQERIAHTRLAIDPPDVLINARDTRVGLFDFHRADLLIEYGREAARRAIPQIEAKLAAAAQRPLGH